MKILTVLLALALLFGCAANVTAENAGGPDTGGDTAAGETIYLTLALEADADRTVRRAAESFCQKARELSGGRLEITTASYSDMFRELFLGGAQMILADSATAAARHRYFAAAAESFRYGSYEEFTITLNAEKVLRALSSACGARVFGAYYTGSNVFGGMSSPDVILLLEREEPGDADEAAVNIYTASDSGTSNALGFTDFLVAEVESPEERLRAIYAPGKLAELSFAEISPRALELAAMPEAAVEDTPREDWDAELTQAVITRSFHTAAPLWLVLSPGVYEELPQAEQLSLREAAAYLAGEIDGEYLRREDERIEELAGRFVTISNDYTATRARVQRQRRAAEVSLPEAERAFIALLNSVYR